MKVASIKVVEVPDGESCKYPPIKPITGSGYCKHLHFELWNKPQKKKIWKCKLFAEDLDASTGEPLKCDRCKQAVVRDNP